MSTPYLQYKTYMIERYGDPLFRIPIDLNLGCPNRNPDGSGGCSFCNEQGARAIQTQQADSIEEQMIDAIRFARNRYGAKKYMAYIQAFSATFETEQQALYKTLLQAHPFTALSIGTRPDCLSPEAYDFLVKLNQSIEVWVELGVQTIHDSTLGRINRGHTWACSEHAIKTLHDRGIKVAVHVILGLPGETNEQFQQTANRLAALPIDAVKIHNLHIEKGTTLADEHAQKNVPTLMEYEFGEQVMDFIRRMPAHIPIMRLTTDTPADQLIAPKWHQSKGAFLAYITQQMVCREWQQGDLVPNAAPLIPPNKTLRTVETKDGSVTFWNETYKEHYHSPAGARLEALEKYIVPSQLKTQLNQAPVQLLDICFGLGYNSLVAMDQLQENQSLAITALEMDRRVVGKAAQNIQSLTSDTFDWKKILSELYQTNSAANGDQSTLSIQWGDARHTLAHLPANTYDIVFLDAFSTQRNSELWTVDFFKKIKRVMKPNAVLLTYCAALPVRSGLLEAGFFVGETNPVGRQRGGTIATQQADQIQLPLLESELKLIHETTRGLPYHDPHGIWSNKEILRNRQERITAYKSGN